MIRFADETSKPIVQQVYHFVPELGWQPADPPKAPDCGAAELQLVTWNIDAVSDLPEQRFLRIMLHLRKKVLGGNPPPPCCILLQEVHEDVLPTLLRHRWIRKHFLITPITTEGWTVPHGLVTLVSKTVPVSTVFAIDLPRTRSGRRALFVDVHLSGPKSDAKDGGKKEDVRIRTVRIANTHLEPEPVGARVRPKQLEGIARLLNVRDTDAQICAGSLCSVRDSDRTAPSESGFVDAYKERNRDGETWGFQPRGQGVPGRLDKVLYFPTEHVEIQSLKRIGFRIKLKDKGYASDHCGLVAVVKMLRDI